MDDVNRLAEALNFHDRLQDFHISLETLWKYRADKIALSQDELDHIYVCPQCVNCLGSCVLCKTLEETRRLQQGELRR
jgi:hypothetical protein